MVPAGVSGIAAYSRDIGMVPADVGLEREELQLLLWVRPEHPRLVPTYPTLTTTLLLRLSTSLVQMPKP